MIKEQLQKFMVSPDITLIEAMSRMDKAAKGILFVCDKDDRLLGCLTDGDIRRCILKRSDLYTTVREAMLENIKYLPFSKKHTAENFMRSKQVNAVPIVDDEKKIVDIIFLAEFTLHDMSFKNQLTGIPVVIMAGGKGTRLYPYTKILPKPLIPVGETPIIERIIDRFRIYGIDEYYLTVNYKKSMIKSYFNDIDPDYQIKYVEENEPLGTGGSLKLIEDTFAKPLFVTNCDILIIAEYDDIYEHHLKNDNDITIVSALKNITVPYGVIQSKENGEIVSMQEKPKLSYFINTGMYIINPETIEKIPSDRMFHMTELVEAVIADGGKVGMYPISEDSFLDMGEFSEMKRMTEKLNVADKMLNN